MTSKAFLVASSLCVALALPVTHGSDRPPRLTKNPFDRPEWFDDSRTVSPSAKPNTLRGRIDLRATLEAGAASLASVGDEIIAIGDDIDGYRLISVDNGRAVFTDGDELIEVKVTNDDQDNNNDTD